MKVKRMVAYAEVGSHGGIFEFVAGPISKCYPTLLHIYRTPVIGDLVPVEIRPLRTPAKRKAGRKGK